MTMGTTLRTWPMLPLRKASEPKMQVVVAKEANTLGSTWRAPAIAASMKSEEVDLALLAPV